MDKTYKKNRLKLNFQLITNTERAAFLEEYLSNEPFLSTPLTASEAETCANYVLWGRDPETGLNSKQSKEIQLETRYKTWDARQDESLENLLENPGFNEYSLRPSTLPATKTLRQTFSRAEARAMASPSILSQLESLWTQIDELDLILNFYDLAHNKRKKPPREELLERFTESQIETLKEKGEHLNSFTYLKMRHLLVELRRDQFGLQDNYKTPIMNRKPLSWDFQEPPTFGSDIKILPIGLKHKDSFSIFPKGRYPNPTDFSDSTLKSTLQEYYAAPSSNTFDFRELEHVYNAFILYEQIEDNLILKDLFNNSKQFLSTLMWYVARANLTDIQKIILRLKLKKIKNQFIAQYINKKFQKSYTANYISTIFRQKIIPQINKAAVHHAAVIENLAFPENFKKCRTCGRVLLIDTANFMRKSRSADGYANQCKICDKKQRDKAKGGN